jgi:hypothetical protein
LVLNPGGRILLNPLNGFQALLESLAPDAFG